MQSRPMHVQVWPLQRSTESLLNPSKSSKILTNLPRSLKNLVKAFQILLILPNPGEFDHILTDPSKLVGIFSSPHKSFHILSNPPQFPEISANPHKSLQISCILLHTAKSYQILPNLRQSSKIFENAKPQQSPHVQHACTKLHEVARSCTKFTSPKKEANP